MIDMTVRSCTPRTRSTVAACMAGVVQPTIAANSWLHKSLEDLGRALNKEMPGGVLVALGLLLQGIAQLFVP